MSPALPNPSMNRRALIRNGGLLLGAGAVLAACGEGVAGTEEPGRIGVAPPGSTLPDAAVNDIVLLRTAQSVEYTLIDLYNELVDLGGFGGSAATLIERLIADHTEHAATLGGLITDAGGEEFACANPFVMNRTVAPVARAVEDSDDVQRDALNTAHAMEVWAAATYQDMVGSLTTAELRQAAMTIGSSENRGASALAILITGAPEAYFSPALSGEQVLPDEDGFPVPYAIVATFGQLGTFDLVVGARNSEGARTTVTLQTPAENSFAYEYMSC